MAWFSTGAGLEHVFSMTEKTFYAICYMYVYLRFFVFSLKEIGEKTKEGLVKKVAAIWFEPTTAD